MRQADWKKRKRLEVDYLANLNSIRKYLISKLHSGLKTAEEMVAAIREASTHSSFLKWANQTASRMVTGMKAQTATTWREAASEGTQGKEIHAALKNEMAGPVGDRVRQLVRENAGLISSLPVEVAEKVNAYIKEQVQKGKRTEEIMKTIPYAISKLTKTRIKLIARTETSKAATALTRARAEELELDCYIWRTSKDSRVRTSHDHMDGVVVFWNDAPSPEQLIGVKSKLGRYHAGDSPNCRCYPEPVLDLNDIKWPAKVYAHGSISYMTRTNFSKILQSSQVAA